MQTTKKKPNIYLIAFGAIISLYLGYLVGAAWKPGRELDEFIAVFSYVCNHPLANYFCKETPKAMLSVFMIYIMIVIMYYTSRRNMMPGKEFGTAKFADVKQINHVLEDPDIGRNRILSQNVKMSLDTRRTKLNNNILIIGGSGAGKTYYEVKPNLMQMPTDCSFIITDPKGEILRSCGNMLKENGYNMKVINLLEMDKSDCYNPFSYIRKETDVVKLITNLIANTTPKGSNPSDPFWEKAESLFLQALFYYVWMECKPSDRNFKTVLQLIGEAKVSDKKEPSRLDIRMKYLEETHPLGSNHPAVKQYNKCMRGAGDTIRSIIISANSRLAFLENEEVLRILSKDDLNLAELGIGVNGDGKTKTALFCVIPDSDKSYNFVIGMLYTQIFQELYHQADFNCGGRLPIHVTFMLDEFSNVALPDDFCSLLSTMRSREISSVIIIQNLAQIKALFKDTWETIPGNCDTLIYLGGNEQSTHKYISELLGKATIDKRSTGETRGRQGSASRNYDVLGRELMTADEARKFDNKKLLIFIRGYDPIVDDKFKPAEHPAYFMTEDGGAEAYVHNNKKTDKEKMLIGKEVEILTPRAVEYYERLKKEGADVTITDMKYEELQLLSAFGVKKMIMNPAEAKAKAIANEELDTELEYPDPEAEEETDDVIIQKPQESDEENIVKQDINKTDRQQQYSIEDMIRIVEEREKNNQSDTEKSGEGSGMSESRTIDKTTVSQSGLFETVIQGKMQIPPSEVELRAGLPEIKGEDTVLSRLATWRYSEEQKNEVRDSVLMKMPQKEILKFFYPDIPAEQMRDINDKYRNHTGKR